MDVFNNVHLMAPPCNTGFRELGVVHLSSLPWPRFPRLREVAAPLRPSILPGETNAVHLLTDRAALPQIRVETLINYEIK